MEKLDFLNVRDLMEWEIKIDTCTDDLVKRIDDEQYWHIMCLQFVQGYKKMAQSMSSKEKILQMSLLSDSKVEKDAVVEWVRATYETHKAEVRLRQAEGKRDSIKKIMSILPIEGRQA